MRAVETKGSNGFFAAKIVGTDGRRHLAAITCDLCPKVNPFKEYHVAVYTARARDVAPVAEAAILAHQGEELVRPKPDKDVTRENYTLIERCRADDWNGWFGHYFPSKTIRG